MNGSNGKRRRIRRTAPAGRPFDEPVTSPSANDRPQAFPVEAPSQCARCGLPFIGDPVMLRLENPQTKPRTLHVCSACIESFDRWVARPSRKGDDEPIRRRVKQTDVADAMISRRRSRGSKRVERNESKARRKFVQTVIGWMLALSILILVFGTLFWFAFSSGIGGRAPSR